MHLLQDNADAEGVSSEGAPPGCSGPPQQLWSRPQQLCSHKAGPHGRHWWTTQAGQAGCVLHTCCAIALSLQSQRRDCPPPFTDKGPEAQREKAIHSRSHHRKCWRTRHLPLSPSLQAPGLNRGSTYWQLPAHPELTFWGWLGTGSPLSI